MSRKIYNFKPSSILNKNENDLIKYLIGSRRESYATTVVEVYYSKNNSWEKQFVGVICFIKDHRLHGFFFRLYSLESETLIWQQEIYKNFQYISKRDFFHLFEGEDCIVGFNFTNIIEADYFRKHVHLKFPIKEEKQIIPKTKSIRIKPKGRVRKVLSKEAISQPLNFQHLAHMPRNMKEQPFCINPELSEVFRKAGITEKNMKNDVARTVIIKIVEERGYSLEVPKNQPNSWLPPVPARKAPPPPKPNGNAQFTLPRISLQPNLPPRIYNIINLKRNISSVTGKPQSTFVPSPIIKQKPLIRENQVIEEFGDIEERPYKPKIGNAASMSLPRVNPLNRPPPPPDFNKFHEMMQPKLNKVNEESGGYNKADSNNYKNDDRDVAESEMDGRGALLDSIRKGVALKSAKQKQDSFYNDDSSESDGRGALLQSIRKGVTLKPATDHVNNVNANKKPNSNNDKLDLVSALKSALDTIDKANRNSSSESEFYDDSDWSETDA